MNDSLGKNGHGRGEVCKWDQTGLCKNIPDTQELLEVLTFTDWPRRGCGGDVTMGADKA